MKKLRFKILEEKLVLQEVETDELVSSTKPLVLVKKLKIV